MNRDQAIALLTGGKDGVGKWNEWRKTSDEVPSLRESNLRDLSLEQVDLNGVDLSFANLIGCDFSGGNFKGANLANSRIFDSGFQDADFSGADLTGANLVFANLRGANFKDAELAGANLGSADVSNASFSGAATSHTHFDRLDLSSVSGLDEITHRAPSTIGIDTLYMSGGNIPEVFLRGCGVPENLIEHLPALIGAQQVIDFYSSVISYSHQDEDFTKRLYSRMRDENLRVWYAPEDMKGGRKIHQQIDAAIRIHDKLLLVLSERSMASEWVATEIYKARQREVKEGRQVLFPIRLVPFEVIRDWESFNAETGKDMAREIREYHIPDFSNWEDRDAFEAAFKYLLRDLKASTESDTTEGA